MISPEQLDELRQAVNQNRRIVKGLLGQLRAANQFLSSLDDQLAELETTAKEAQDEPQHQHAAAVV